MRALRLVGMVLAVALAVPMMNAWCEEVRYEDGKVLLRGHMDGNAVAVERGQEVSFELTIENSGAEPNIPYFICWERKGDDGVVANGKEQWQGAPVVVLTSMDKPGFVRITANIQDETGKALGGDRVNFNGGFGVPNRSAGTFLPLNRSMISARSPAGVSPVTTAHSCPLYPRMASATC